MWRTRQSLIGTARFADPRDNRGYLPSLAKRVQWLLDEGAVCADTAPRWNAIRELRNIGSHADFQMLHPPGDVLTSPKTVAETVTAVLAAHES